MPKLKLLLLTLFIPLVSHGQRIETIYLNPNDSTTNMYVAVFPEKKPIKSFLVLMDSYGNSPKGVLAQTDIPTYAAQQGILTIIPLLATGSTYFGSDRASLQSLRDIVRQVVARYQLQGKDFFIGGFSIGGTCAVKYAELTVQENDLIKPTAVFAINSPFDWERYYNGAKRVARLSDPAQVSKEVYFMIERIEKEMNGTPETALQNYYNQSPYSFSDTTQKAIKYLVNTPIMLISEPDIQWWLQERGYDLSYNNITDHSAMINELQRLGNKNAVLVTTTNKGYRIPDNTRHPNSWSIADPEQLIKWLLGQSK
ncbi:MAG: alpha/beta hydrolase [Bacteroidia bacterium]|nr:alpha/beta hydrolase [Bacteroidia bacterium]